MIVVITCYVDVPFEQGEYSLADEEDHYSEEANESFLHINENSIVSDTGILRCGV